jgi:exodeoxyribonuclease VII small subunit
MAAKKKNDTQSDALTFEAALSELEGITRELERDDLTLEDALSRFEGGVKLMRACDGHLRSAKGRLSELAKGEDGEFIVRILGDSLESFAGGEIRTDNAECGIRNAE